MYCIIQDHHTFLYKGEVIMSRISWEKSQGFSCIKIRLNVIFAQQIAEKTCLHVKHFSILFKFVYFGLS